MKNHSKKTGKIILTAIILVIMIGVVSNPSSSIKSAREGLEIWLFILLPSLFPFILISDLLISLGFVNYISRFLQPLMKPLFNVSGVGIFPLMMSMMSGYPIGAKLTSKLRQENTISKTMGNRLIGFSSTSGTLFILGTVLIGMLNAPHLSLIMLLPHYLGAITLGFIFRFYKKDSFNGDMARIGLIQNPSSQNNDYSIGQLIGNSVKDSMDSIIIIGGFVIIYSVVIDLLLDNSLFNLILNRTSVLTGINPNYIKGLLAGIIEITKGCNIVASLDLPIISKIILINFIIGWGGLSIHSQAISFISKTDLSKGIYLIAKAAHGIISAIYTYVIYKIIYHGNIVPVFYNPDFQTHVPGIQPWMNLLIGSTKIASLSALFLLILSIFMYSLDRYLNRSL